MGTDECQVKGLTYILDTAKVPSGSKAGKELGPCLGKAILAAVENVLEAELSEVTRLKQLSW